MRTTRIASWKVLGMLKTGIEALCLATVERVVEMGELPPQL